MNNVPLDASESLSISPAANAAGDARAMQDAEASPKRRIGLHHIAFLRGYFEGLDVGGLADQYLDFGRDRKRAQAARRWIVDELVAAARKRGDSAGARLLKLPVGALPSLDDGQRGSISLDEYREQFDPDGVYSESELLELFEAAQRESGGGDRRAARNTRLRQRQRSLLESLEASLAEPPRLQHRLSDWLDHALSLRLAASGLMTVSALFEHIEKHGYRWYRRVPKVGEQAARRILQWFDRNKRDLGVTIRSTSRTPRALWSAMLHAERRQHQGTLAPIEYFDPLSVDAQADRGALLDCLDDFSKHPATFRAYRLQAERLLLWSVLIRKKPLSALTGDDAQAFLVFVAHPPSTWCGPKAERGTADWRPFERAAAQSSVAIARRILKSVCDRLEAKGYLRLNPFVFAAGLPREAGEQQDRPVDVSTPAERRSIQMQQSQAVLGMAALNSHLDHVSSDDLRSLRMRMVMLLVRDTGASLGELVRIPIDAMAGAAGRFAEDTLLAIKAYLDARRLVDGAETKPQGFLIGRHVSPSDNAVPRALTPNVLARAVSRYVRSIREAHGASIEVESSKFAIFGYRPLRMAANRALKARRSRGAALRF